MNNVSPIDVMDAACSPCLADALLRAYRSHALMHGFVDREDNLSVVFEGEDGPWVGGGLSSEARRCLAAGLVVVRRQVEATNRKPFAMPLDLHGDPYFRDVFDRQPDAWMVVGGTDDPVQVTTVAERDAEVARRQQQMKRCS